MSQVRALVGTFVLLVAAAGCALLEPDTTSGDLEVLWEVPAWVSTQPVVAGDLLIAGEKDGTVVAYNRRTGAVRWRRQLNAIIEIERLLLAGDVVVVPGVTLFALDVRTGVVRWSRFGADRTDGTLTPALAGDTLFVPGFTGQEATALDVRTGIPFWSVPLGKTVFVPTVTDSLVLYPLRFAESAAVPEELVALDRRDGSVRWRHAFRDSLGVRGGALVGGAVVDDRVIVGTKIETVVALRLADGALLWEVIAGGPRQGGYGRSALRVGTQVVLHRANGVMESRDATEGQLAWSLANNGRLSSFAVQRCGAELCRADGRLRVVDTSGREVWAYGGLNQAVFLSNVSVAEDGLMYAGVVYGTNDTRLIAFRPPVRVGPTSPN